MIENKADKETSKNKRSTLSGLTSLHRRYDGPIPKEYTEHHLPHDAEAEKWLRFWRGQVLHAVYALRRQRTLRFQQRTRNQFRQWRGGIITRRKTLTSALHSYRSLQQQKNRPEN